MRLITYQALLSNPQNVARVRAAKGDIERIGGTVSIAPPTNVGMVLVLVELPDTHRPEQFFPGMPFYPL
jgi:hypothetical protein